MAIQEFFPYVPHHISWEDWNGALIHYFSEEPIEYHKEAQWKQTAKSVSNLATFSVYPVPDPDDYAQWQDWALEFTQIINGPSQ
jgi:hypothetical protein